MLQRMNELAVQASNGTNSESDRSSIQAEIDQLTTEIDRVAETTKFNETYLLKGDNGKKDIYLKAHDAGLDGTLTQNTSKATFSMNALAMGDTVTIGGTKYTIGVAGDDAAEQLQNALKVIGAGNGTAATVTTGDVITIDGKSYTIDGTEDVQQAKITAGGIGKFASAGSTITFNGNTAVMFSTANTTGAAVDQKKATLITAEKAYEMITTELKAASSIGADSQVGTVAKKLNNADYDTDNANNKLKGDLETNGVRQKVTFSFDKVTTKVQNELLFNLHVGADADMTNKIGVTIENMNSASLGIKGLNVSDATGKAATYAIDAIADAVEKVSAQRSALGAIQNRLEHTIANVDNVVENTNAAESRIRDTDMAEEMVNYSKNNILAQAGQSMLAQANQSTQGVLSILG
jgi:flagellin